MKRIALLIVLLGACPVNIPHPVTVRIADDGTGSAPELKPQHMKLGGPIAPQGGTITSVQPASGGGLTGGGTAGAVTLGLSSAGCSPGYVPTWSGTAWTCAAGSPAGTITGTLTNGDLAIATGTNTLGPYGGSTPAACTTGNVVTGSSIAATGVLSQTCTAIGTAGGVTGTGTNHYYAQWTSTTAIGSGHILDDGAFNNTTEFTNGFNLFDNGVAVTTGGLTVDNGDVIAGQTGSGRLESYYSIGTGLSSGNYNIVAFDIGGTGGAGQGGNLQLWGNIAASGLNLARGGELKASKTTSTANDDTFDLIASTCNAGTCAKVATFGHDTSFAVVGALTADAGSRVFDATGTGLTSSANTVSIATTGVSPGTYANATVTVNAQGQLTAASGGTTTVTGTGANTELAVWSGAQTQTGYSTLTTDSSGNLTANTLNASEVVGTVNTTPAAIYTPGTVGIGLVGATTPGTYLDIRHNWQSGWDDFEIVNDGNTTSHGPTMDWVRGLGTLSAPTETGASTEIYRMDSWGYDSANTIGLGEFQRVTVDQTPTSGVVPMRLDLWMMDASGTIRNRFRFDSAGHWGTVSPAVPVISSCGTGATLNFGTDDSGSVALGTGATGCTITFSESWATTLNSSPPHCAVTSESGIPFTFTVSNTALTISEIGPMSSTSVDWQCSSGGQQ